MASGPFIGTVKSFNDKKGWGFIECDQTMNKDGSDIFLMSSDLKGQAVERGDQVTFMVKDSSKGARAAEIRILGKGGGGDAGGGNGWGVVYTGELKSYNPEKGYGFITCAAAMQTFGKDVFVSRRMVEGMSLMPGSRVQFRATCNDKGPIATEVTPLDAAPAMYQPAPMDIPMGIPPLPPWASMMPPPFMGAFDPMMWGAAAAAMAAPPLPPPWGADMSSVMSLQAQQQALPNQAQQSNEREVFIGTLKGTNSKKGWGHISCPASQRIYGEPGKDVFILRSDLDLVLVEVGQTVSFCVAHGPKGPHAVNIKPFDAPGPDVVFRGAVKSFNEGKGWGFISLYDGPRGLSMDVFAHKKDMEGRNPKPGDRVQFTLDYSTGRLAAKNVKPTPKKRGNR